VILSNQQAELINQAIDRLRVFTDMYGDDISELILKKLDLSFAEKNTSPKKPISIIISFPKKEQSQIFGKYWRTRNTLSVTKTKTTVELEVLNKLTDAPLAYIRSLFETAGEIDMSADVDECIILAKHLLDAGGELVSVSHRT
jgi:hypothetical protein